jgi:ribosomal protein L30/L7E
MHSFNPIWISVYKKIEVEIIKMLKLKNIKNNVLRRNNGNYKGYVNYIVSISVMSIYCDVLGKYNIFKDKCQCLQPPQQFFKVLLS